MTSTTALRAAGIVMILAAGVVADQSLSFTAAAMAVAGVILLLIALPDTDDTSLRIPPPPPGTPRPARPSR